MSDPVILAITAVFTALIAGAPATIAAIAALRQGQKNAENAEALKTDVREIHALTNSTNSNLTKALAVATEKVAGLEKMVATLVEREKVDLARQSIPNQKPEVVDANGDTAKGPSPHPPATALVDPQGDRIEKTGEDSNARIRNVEVKTADKIAEVEAKVDNKEDKT